MTTQAEMLSALRRAPGAEAKRDLALALLAKSRSRQVLDECLRVLHSQRTRSTLDERHRPPLRAKCLAWHADTRRDKAALLRESATRLLVHIAHPDDLDIYQLGVETYYLQPVDDVAQNLRAAALAGMAPIARDLACLYAARFLGDPHTSVFNCEPALTAVDVLAAANQRLPIYQFLLRDGVTMAQTRRGELAGKALESLGADFPPRLYADLIELYAEIDQPTASMGIINWIIERRESSLYDRLERLTLETKDADLRRYALVMLAAARDDELSERLLRMARMARRDDIPLFLEALEICRHEKRDETLSVLTRRAR